MPPSYRGPPPRRSARRKPPRPVVVASKPFAESYLLAEAFAQLLEAHGHTVERRPGLGTTELVLQALRGGDIDVYPEYTGTGLVAVLGETAQGGSAAVFRRVSDAFEERWGLRFLPPLGFENTYAMAMRRTLADSLDVRTLSELAALADGLVGGFSPDFIGRADGLGRPRRRLRNRIPGNARPAPGGQVPGTGGGRGRRDRRLLDRWRHLSLRPHLAGGRPRLLPSVRCRPAGRRRPCTRSSPGAVMALTRMAGRIDEEAVRRANERIEVEGASIADAARELLEAVGLGEPQDAARPDGGRTAPSRRRDERDAPVASRAHVGAPRGAGPPDVASPASRACVAGRGDPGGAARRGRARAGAGDSPRA